MILVLFTTSYPYDFSAEYTFLSREVPYLAGNINKVIIVPRISKGNRLSIPPTVEVDDSYSAYYKENTDILSILSHALGSVSFYEELRSHFLLLLNPFKLAKLILSLGRAEITRRWVEDWIIDCRKNSELVFYSYWFDDIVVGLGLVKRQHPQIKLVSRAHGYDIYEELYFPFYWPCRQQVLSTLDKLFPASEDGANYFREKYPHFASIVESAHLGVKDPGFRSNSSMDNVFRIVSCAHIVSLKRLDLLLKGIALAAHQRPDRKFDWIHFGGGEGQKALERIVQQSLRTNFKSHVTGNVPNEQIMLHYKEKPVDVFINVSSTEGTPVSIMEAISCGMPVIATSVGGNSEIVSERNGILLSPDPAPQEIANAIFALLDNPEMAILKRRGSREVWLEQYNADVNFRLFAERLKSIQEDQ